MSTVWTRQVMWRLQDRGVEHVRVAAGGESLLVDGVQTWLGEQGGQRRVRYLLTCDVGWRVRELHVDTPEDGGALSLHRDPSGAWTDRSGAVLPQLQGCEDVDVSAVLFTNTLPIRRLMLAIGESREIEVAFVRVPSLEVAPTRQRYTRLGEGMYLYEGLESGFRAELRVDDEGLVIDYPGLGRRMWAL